MAVKLDKFSAIPFDENADKFGFSLHKKLSDAMNLYLDSHQDKCVLTEQASELPDGEDAIYFLMDFKNKQ